MSRFPPWRALLPLVAHKAADRARRWADEQGGLRRAVDRETAWAVAWQRRVPSIGAWLARPGAGRLWLDPTVAPRWARRTAAPEDLAYADRVLAGHLPRLNADPAVGHPPAWRRDGYTGREWPLEPAFRIPLQRGDGGDIRTVWELGRCQHFTLLAKAFWRTGDRRYADAVVTHVDSWLSDNPPGLGPNWRSPMDAAIRGANWALTVPLLAEAPEIPHRWWAALLTNLRLTARFVARYLEWHPVYRGNHFLANGVGLAYLGALFVDEPIGRSWFQRGTKILREEMAFQVRPDGVGFEAALGYHRLVTEFFAFGGMVVERTAPGSLPSVWWERLRRMHVFLAAYLDDDGRAPLLGDADDGRLHHLCARAATRPREHRLGLPRRFWPTAPPSSAAFPTGGFYVLRHHGDRCVVRCGPVGLNGAGSHDHNDQLSYELVLDRREVIADSGTYAYTRDFGARFAFRATGAHNAVQLGGEEQNPIRPDRPWRVLADRARARCTHWHTSVTGTRFEGLHHGFAHRSSRAICRRAIEVHAATGVWQVVDTIEGHGIEAVVWRLHLAPGEATVTDASREEWEIVHSAAPGHRLFLAAGAPLALAVKTSPWSPRYGEIRSRPMLHLGGQASLPLVITLRIVPDTPGTSPPAPL